MTEPPRVVRAGRTGDDVRSDLSVTFEPTDRDGREVELKSRVAPYYGRTLHAQIQETLERLGVEHARVAVDDRGALPFVVEARVEAAVRACGLGTGRDARPERAFPERGPSAPDRMRRSRLYLPGNEPKYMINAGLHRPDAIILDLEDSVHPGSKDAARLLVRNALRCVDFGDTERMVRINQLPLGLTDLEVIAPERPDLLLLPKVEDPEQVREVDIAIDRILGAVAAEHPIWLMPILESALGIERAFRIATASEHVVALTVGLEDLTVDLGVAKTEEGEETAWARSRVVNAARAAGIQAIDSVYGDVGNLEGLEWWAARSKALGFEGMGCLHPRQIPVVHDTFAPTRVEIERALAIVEAFEGAERRGEGVVSLGTKMIDPPVVERARRLVARATAMGWTAGNPKGRTR